MCLGSIATVTATWDEGGLPMASVDDGREERVVCLAYVPDTAVGDSVLAHLGFVLERLDPQAAADARELRDRGG